MCRLSKSQQSDYQKQVSFTYVFVIVYLDDILIYTEYEGEGHVKAVRWVLDQLRKYSLYANLKKCRFHQEEVRFFGYIVSHQGIQMEEEQIKAVHDWPEP